MQRLSACFQCTVTECSGLSGRTRDLKISQYCFGATKQDFQCCFNACAMFSKENCQELKTGVDSSGKELWFWQRIFSYFFYPHKIKFLPDVAFIREINWLYMGVTFTTINHCSNTSVLTFYSKRVSKTSSWILFVNSRHFKILSVCTLWFILSHSFSFH